MARGGHMRKELPEIYMVTWSDLGVLIQSRWCALKPCSLLLLLIYTHWQQQQHVYGSGCAIHRLAHVV
jgi:hypothetical protein